MRYIMNLALLLITLSPCYAQAIVAGGNISPDGTERVRIDYPTKYRFRNTGGSDGAGLCVFKSISYLAHWQHEPRLHDLHIKMQHERGGGWPQKVDQMIEKYGSGAQYFQYEGSDLSVLRSILDSGRMVAVTYAGFDNVNYRSRISHMLCLVHLSDKWAAIIDNNGEASRTIWMTPEQFRQRWVYYRQGWALALIAPAPPPIPTDRDSPAPLPATPQPQPNAPEPLCPGPYCPRVYRWIPDTYRRHSYLWLDSQCLGRYDLASHRYQYYDASTNSWHEYSTPVGYDVERVDDYGLRLDWLSNVERFKLNGFACDRATALHYARTPLPNDSALLRVTAIGSSGKKFLEALKPHTQHFTTQYYEDATHWHIDGLGFPSNGVVVQKPAGSDGRGKVLLWREGDTDVAEVLRLRDPEFKRPVPQPDNAAPTPNTSRPLIQPVIQPQIKFDFPPLFIALVGAGIGVFVLRKVVQ